MRKTKPALTYCKWCLKFKDGFHFMDTLSTISFNGLVGTLRHWNKRILIFKMFGYYNRQKNFLLHFCVLGLSNIQLWRQSLFCLGIVRQWFNSLINKNWIKNLLWDFSWRCVPIGLFIIQVYKYNLFGLNSVN